MQEHGRSGLGVGDGFRFGCGFILAGVVLYLFLIALFGVIALVISLLGYALTLPGVS